MAEYSVLSLETLIQKRATVRGFQDFSLDNPKTLMEKLQWLNIHDDIERRAYCADKVLVHEYAKEKIGKDICVPIIKVYDSPSDVRLAELPEKFVLKCNHGYAFNIICRNKNSLNEKECQIQLQKWLDTPFGEKTAESHYLYIKRKCYAEKFLENKGQNELTDYKFVCFNGKPIYVQIINNRHENTFHLNWYDMNFNFVDISRIDICSNKDMPDRRPSGFELMKEYAAKLSSEFRFVRVDFYEVDGKVYLGEMTFTPATCFIKYKDPNTDRMLGDMLKL